MIHLETKNTNSRISAWEHKTWFYLLCCDFIFSSFSEDLDVLGSGTSGPSEDEEASDANDGEAGSLDYSIAFTLRLWLMADDWQLPITRWSVFLKSCGRCLRLHTYLPEYFWVWGEVV